MRRALLPLLAALLTLALSLGQARAEETPAYVALGDSLAFGVGASDPASGGYVARTFEALRRSERYSERGLALVNLGVPGATSADLLLPGGQLEAALQEIERRQDDTSSQDDNVEIISIDIGGNDLFSLGTGDAVCLSDPLGEECRQAFLDVLDALEVNLAQVVARLREAAPKADIIVLALYNPFSGRGGVEEGPADLGIRQLNAVLSDVASDPQLGAKLADVFPFFQGRGRQWIAPDVIHPNDKGHTAIAEVLLAAIEERAPVLPSELTKETPAPAVGGLDGGSAGSDGSDGDGTDIVILLAIAIPAAFAGGAAISGAYFLARGRSR